MKCSSQWALSRICLVAVAMGLSSSVFAAPGFLRAEFSHPSSAYDDTSDIWTATNVTTVLAPTDIYQFTTPEKTTYAYAAYMWFEAGKGYYFQGQYDDTFSVKVDDVMIVSRPGECKQAAAGISLKSSGWHKLEVRCSNNGGAGGANSSYTHGGVWLQEDSGAWNKLADPGDGSKFRTDAPASEIETLQGYVYAPSGTGVSLNKILGGTESKSIILPESIGGLPVIALGASLMQNNTSVMKVVIPETVTSIGSYAFSGCIALTSCNIPAGVTDIPAYLFKGCSKLRSIELPTAVTHIGTYAFSGCSSLTSIDLPEGLTTISSDAFSDCSSLTSIALPDSVISFGNYMFASCSKLKTVRLSVNLVSIPYETFYCCGSLESVVIPYGVTSIGGYAFYGCGSLRELVVPASVTSVGGSAFSSVGRVIFQGPPPAGLASAGIASVVYPEEYGARWKTWFDVLRTGGYLNPNAPVVEILSVEVRANDPTILDVVYRVASTKPTVKVRALAFEDGVRSFAKVTRPETFVDGTGVNLGDAIVANVEHTLSWQVSADFKTDLANMKFEVLAVEDGILPLEFLTIPANGTNRAMELSWNALTYRQVFDALLWLYADKDAGLTLTDGVLKSGTAIVAENSSIKTVSKNAGSSYDANGSYQGSCYSQAWRSAPEYVFSRMGFTTLSGDALTYANDMTRLGLVPSGVRQYAYRWTEQ